MTTQLHIEVIELVTVRVEPQPVSRFVVARGSEGEPVEATTGGDPCDREVLVPRFVDWRVTP